MTRFRLPANWPAPADPVAARSLAEVLAPHVPEPDAATLSLIACLGGNSPYLSDLARREPELLVQLLHHGPDRVASAALRRLRALRPDLPLTRIAAGLRRAKRQLALVTAIADLGGLWSLQQVTGALSLLAEAALRVSVAHLLLTAHRSGLLHLPAARTPERGSGFVVLAMGKLGAHELNYSSDIDLVLLYDPAAQPDQDELARTFARLATDLVSLMEARDADGYVFRMDLRLRPDPGATPPAVSLPAAITYYESHGQNWERAAMTKARPVAGDLAVGERFLQAIRPFIWRRHLDFAAIEDIHAMKRRIDRHKPSPSRRFGTGPFDIADPVAMLLGHDLKLGHGGIREIEFIAQTLQLVWGGREPGLRDPTTLGALSELVAGGYLECDTARFLSDAYRLLRRVEHRLQMQSDRQTHSLPVTAPGLDSFAVFMGYADAGALAVLLVPVLRGTRDRFERLLDDRVSSTSDEPGAPFQPFAFDDIDLAYRLDRFGFPPGPQAEGILRGWHGDGMRALRQPRAHMLLQALAPSLLLALGRQRDPLAALARFDTLLSRQASLVQLLSLFGRNPALVARIATILGAAPSLADHLATVPAALEGLLVPENGQQAAHTVLRMLDRQMRHASSVEEAIRIARTLVRGEEFRLSVARLDGHLDADAEGTARTRLAERVIARMRDHVVADHRRRYGVVPGGGMVVLALGKAGSREMMSGSDLDLMLVYDHPEQAIESVPGRYHGRAIASSQYYTRLAHALIAALSAPGLEGPLYALDMRLRPSGNKGPVAVSLAAFRRYHAEQAWTWERMALSRARVVAGPTALRRTVASAIATALSIPPHQPGTMSLHADAAAMRARIAHDLPPHGPWDVKLRPGGLMELEFIAQILQLSSCVPSARHPTTRTALARLSRAGLLPRQEARRLIEADRFWRALQGMLRILLGVQLPHDLRAALSEPVAEALLRGMSGPDDLPALEALRDRMADTVRDAFERLVGPLPGR